MTTPRKTATKRATPKTKTPPKLDIDALLEAKTPPTLAFPIVTATHLADAAEEAKAAFDEIQQRVERAERAAQISETAAGPSNELLDERDTAKAAYEKAKAEADAATIPFVFQALPRAALLALYAEYPPTEKQKRDFAAEMKILKQPITSKLDINEDTLPPVLIFRAMKEPEGITWDDVKDWWYGPECPDCGGVGCDLGVMTMIQGEEETCRRPDLGKWSKAELDGMFSAAAAVNRKIK